MAKPRPKTAAGVKKKKKRKKSSAPIFISGGIVLVIALGTACAYFIGRAEYDGKFPVNTYINDVNVSGKTLSEVERLFENKELPEKLTVIKHDGSEAGISLESFGYTSDTDRQLEKIYSEIDHSLWFKGLIGKVSYSFTENITYDKDKLKELLSGTDWGSAENKNAEIELTDSGYIIRDAVQGDKMNYEILENYILSAVDRNEFTVKAEESGCYIPPEITAKELKDECERLNRVFNMKITYDFDYTTETLTGKKLLEIADIDEDGNITADRDKAMEYVEYLAKKYDTFNTERKFHATIQGDITIPTSSDAKYGWWIDQEKTCGALVEMIENGKSKEGVDPIYYETGGYVFTGSESARSKDDDIGDTYIEIDLTNQQFWYYEKGKLKKECYIVSGQTTSAARTTLPGVYKVWSKATNYRMKDSNADGDEWDTTCDYWTRVAIVGIGLHDSQWRYYFGGDIYKYNGSHGCINMPLEYAKFVHDKVPMDTPVVMYY